MIPSDIYNIRAYRQWDFRPIVDHMREDDVREVWATAHMTPAEGVAQSVLMSRDVKVGCVHAKPVCIFGVSPSYDTTALSRKGSPWLLGTDEMEQHALPFLYHSRDVVASMLQEYDYLENYVDARNEKSIKWLSWLGFDIAKEATPWGVEQLPFFHFEMQLL